MTKRKGRNGSTRKQNGKALKKNPGGRKLLLNDPTFRENFLDAIGKGLNQIDACRLNRIDDSTYRKWRILAETGREPYRTFFTQIDEARATLKDRLLSKIRTIALQDTTDTADAWRLLGKLWPDEYGAPKQHVTLAGDPKAPLRTTVELLRQAHAESRDAPAVADEEDDS